MDTPRTQDAKPQAPKTKQPLPTPAPAVAVAGPKYEPKYIPEYEDIKWLTGC